MSYCPKCGSPLGSSDRFCPACGGGVGVPVEATPRAPAKPAVSPRPSSAAPSIEPVAVPKRSGWRTAFLMGGGCLLVSIVLVALIVGGVLMFTGGAADVANEHLAMIRDGRVEEAYQRTSPDFQKLVELAAYREMVETRAILREMRGIGISERSIENGVATIVATIKDAAGGSFKVPMRLREEEGQWRLIAIDWSEVPVGLPVKNTDVPRAELVLPEPASDAGKQPESKHAGPVQSAVKEAGASTQEPMPAASSQPPPAEQPSVGSVVFGSGRDANGDLIWPGDVVSKRAPAISADVQMIHRLVGGRVRVWIERPGAGAITETVEAQVLGKDEGGLRVNFQLPEKGIEPGEYALIVLLGENGRFKTPFKVK